MGSVGYELIDTSLVARHISSRDWGTYASAVHIARRGAPSDPSDLNASLDLVGYFSSLTGRVAPLLFERDGEHTEVDLRGRHGVFVNESTAHLTSLVGGLGVVFHRSRDQSARLRAFVDWVVELFVGADCSGRAAGLG